MTADDYIDPHVFAMPWSNDTMTVALIDLDNAADFAMPIIPPLFPVIGVGNPDYGLAAQMDAVVEPPAIMATLLENIRCQPEAAAVLVQLLRLLEKLDVQTALIAESLAYGLLQGSEGHAAWLMARRPVPASPLGRVTVERSDNILHICMDRPRAYNTVDRDMRDGLREAFEMAAFDHDISKVIFRGAGKAFCAGADLAEFGTTRDPATAHAIRLQTLPAHAISRCADKLHVHVQGACIGSGLEMAAFAKHITVSPDAWFQLPELRMGLIPGAGGCVSVSRRIGRQRAALMILSGKRIGAQTALDWGLIDAIVDD